jgi:hypothetical protein
MSEEGEPDDWLYGEPPPGTLRLHYIKSPYFRVIHVDGVWGGLTGRGLIHAALYSERRAIPQVTEMYTQGDGELSQEKVVRSKKHIAREVEADLLLDAKTAKELGEWLLTKVKEHDKLFYSSDQT